MEPSSVIHPAVAACSSMVANPASQSVPRARPRTSAASAGQSPHRRGRNGDVAVRLDGTGIVHTEGCGQGAERTVVPAVARFAPESLEGEPPHLVAVAEIDCPGGQINNQLHRYTHPRSRPCVAQDPTAAAPAGAGSIRRHPGIRCGLSREVPPRPRTPADVRPPRRPRWVWPSLRASRPAPSPPPRAWGWCRPP